MQPHHLVCHWVWGVLPTCYLWESIHGSLDVSCNHHKSTVLHILFPLTGTFFPLHKRNISCFSRFSSDFTSAAQVLLPSAATLAPRIGGSPLCAPRELLTHNKSLLCLLHCKWAPWELIYFSIFRGKHNVWQIVGAPLLFFEIIQNFSKACRE